MTTQPAVSPPAHPLHALTTSELAAYRHQLETALAAQDATPPGQGGLRDSLAAVLAEQDDRARLAAAANGEHCHG